MAGKGLVTSKVEIEHQWETQLSLAEERLRQNWFEQQLVPLSRSVPMFEVRKLQTISLAEGLLENRKHAHGPQKTGGFEQWVETKDKLIGGRIDQILRTATDIVIRDFKTGSLTLGGTTEIKDEYVTQLQAYAGLYFETNGNWPTKLELVPLQGAPVEVKFNQQDCLSLLERARQELISTNNTLSVSTSDADIATVTEECHFCQFRPACRKYLDSTGTSKRDFSGILEKVLSFRNGTRGIVARHPETKKEFTLIGLNMRPERHPALEQPFQGGMIFVFNAAGRQDAATFIESELTTIYTQ
jgi:hypothetical protein